MPTSEQFDQAYAQLNTKQKEAVDAIEGPVMVIAGPGSGKTQILSMRVGNILNQTDALPSNILCLTFTESAAVNMRERLAGLIGRDAYRVAIHTFHNFGVDIIGRHPEFFYNNALLSPADELVQIEVITGLLEAAEHDNPLRSQHPEQGYTYLHSIRTAIGQLKKAGLTPAEFRAVLDSDAASLACINPWMEKLFAERLTKDKVGEIADAIRELRAAVSDRGMPVPLFQPLEAVVADSLEHAMQQAAEEESTAPVSKWKQKWAPKDENGKRVFKDALSLERLYALADVYEQYSTEMYRRGYIDFDDMILDTIQAVEQNTVLRSELQEQFRYILVDEFQDTNDAQMRLLHAITDSPVNEGRPNLMVVGDDDQAIYKFQGAEISNILNFRETYQDPTIITMTENYRSRQDILDVARFVITKGEERLENRLPDISKELTASKGQLSEGDIAYATFPSRAHEYSYVANEVARQIENGTDPSEIALIARQHKHLKELLPYLYNKSIPLRYERQQNVLAETHVRQLIRMARFIGSLARKQRAEADELLPEILAYPFWGLERSIVWRLSVTAARENKLWLEVMEEHDDERVREIAAFFIDTAIRSLNEPLEFILDYLIGSHVPLLRESEDGEEEGGGAEGAGGQSAGDTALQSPFREHYFSEQEFDQNKDQYLTFLSSLRVFLDAVREYKQGEVLGVDDLVAFVDLHEQNNIPVVDTSPFVSADHAVQLLTAHKAKGLEFDTVFVLSCVDEVWTPRGRGSNLSFPLNMPITAAGDTVDDQLRLFYVALTRAKRQLFITSYQADESGKERMPIQFLVPDAAHDSYAPSVRKLLTQRERAPETTDVPATTDVLTASVMGAHAGPFVHDEQALLGSLVEDYQMSVTHLNNFVNVAQGGPQLFLEQNLLRFPQAKTASAAFGTAVHKALELLYVHLRKHEKLPADEQVLAWFREALKKERMAPRDFEVNRTRGEKALAAYVEQKRDRFDPSDKVEVNFKNQGVLIGEAHLAGKIDRLSLEDANTAVVHDYKTGRAKTKWTGSSPLEKIQLHNYKQQLVVYKLLIEESRDYSQYTVKKGVLEFVEPKNGKLVSLELEIEDDDVVRTRSLIEAVYKRITTLAFPDVSGYSADVKGVEQFEDDLIAGEV
ncbi:MAG: ATP-dependent DNA helicase [Candidatus Paceibacterota bacterium]